jgi:hypothetical protein
MEFVVIKNNDENFNANGMFIRKFEPSLGILHTSDVSLAQRFTSVDEAKQWLDRIQRRKPVPIKVSYQTIRLLVEVVEEIDEIIYRELLRKCNYPEDVLEKMTDEECEGECEILGLCNI